MKDYSKIFKPHIVSIEKTRVFLEKAIITYHADKRIGERLDSSVLNTINLCMNTELAYVDSFGQFIIKLNKKGYFAVFDNYKLVTVCNPNPNCSIERKYVLNINRWKRYMKSIGQM